MREIRHVYIEQKKKEVKRWYKRVGLAYGLAALLAAVIGIFADQQERKKEEKG